MTESPFARYGLFRNPFGELTIDERAVLAVVDLPPMIKWLESSNMAVLQVIGPCGHGKSTHLRALQLAWSHRAGMGPDWAGSITAGSITARSITAGQLPAFVYFPEQGGQPALPCSRPLFIDEAQRMSRWRRWQMCRRPGPLVIGTHDDWTQWLTRAGFQVWTVDLSQPVPVDNLQTMLNRRISASAINHTSLTNSAQPVVPNHPLHLTVSQVVALQQRFGSNIRGIEDYLYIQVQQLVLKGQPWLPVA